MMHILDMYQWESGLDVALPRALQGVYFTVQTPRSGWERKPVSLADQTTVTPSQWVQKARTCSHVSAITSTSAEGVAGVGGEMGVISGLDDVVVTLKRIARTPHDMRWADTR
jgi:hypothetical protein